MRNKKQNPLNDFITLDSPFCTTCKHSANCKLLQFSLETRKSFCLRFSRTFMANYDEYGVTWYKWPDKKFPVKDLLPEFISEYEKLS